jgi:hypothetical protein
VPAYPEPLGQRELGYPDLHKYRHQDRRCSVET